MAGPLNETLDAPPPATAPLVALRLVTVHDDVTRRIDLELLGSRGVAIEDGTTTSFETARLWPTIQELLPPLDVLRAEPAGRRTTGEAVRPGPDWVQDCRAMVTIATLAGPEGTATEDPEGAVRTWFATDDALWSATPQPDGSTDVRRAPDGALADLLIWDVTGAMEALVQRLQAVAS